MSGTGTISARINPETKAQAVDILSELEMTLTQAVSLFLKQVIYTRGIPFEIRLPSERSLKTMAKIDAGKGLHEVANADELLKELKS